MSSCVRFPIFHMRQQSRSLQTRHWRRAKGVDTKRFVEECCNSNLTDILEKLTNNNGTIPKGHAAERELNM